MKYITDKMETEYGRRQPYSIKCAKSWLNYWGDPIFDLCEQSGSGPAIVVPQGHFEAEIPLKQIVLIQKCLEADPEILNKFLALAIDKEKPNQAIRTSKLTPRRRVSTKKTNVLALKKPKSIIKSSFDESDFLDDLTLVKC